MADTSTREGASLTSRGPVGLAGLVGRTGSLRRDTKVTDGQALHAEVASFLDGVAAACDRPATWESTRWAFWWGLEALDARARDPRTLPANLRVWRDTAHVIAAVAFHDEPGTGFDVVVGPGWVEETAIVLADAVQAWGRDGAASVTALAGAPEEPALAALGFRRALVPHGQVHVLATSPQRPVALLPGYSVQDLRHTGDRNARQLCMAHAFEPSSPDPVEPSYPRSDLPGYRPELDLAVVAPHGLPVATCFGFVPGGDTPAVVETVGTVPGLRRLGLATAVVSRCLNLLADQGVPYATIAGWSTEANAVYRRLRPVRSYAVHRWSRDASPRPVRPGTDAS